MPFGFIFAALYFALCAWTGIGLLAEPALQPKAGGLLLGVAGIALVVGLLARRPWARWVGIAGALGAAVFGVWRLDVSGGPMDLVLLLGGLAAAGLLALPATGAAPAVSERRSGLALPALAGLASLGVVAIAASGLVTEPPPSADAPALPASLSERVRWSGFGQGIERARREDTPLLVNFNAAWCGYCKQMDGSTWKHPSVVERLGEMVAVRVDIDDEAERDGYADAAVAARYGVQGTPTQLLIAPDGRVIAQAGGYQSPRDFLTWLEASLGRNPDAGIATSRP